MADVVKVVECVDEWTSECDAFEINQINPHERIRPRPDLVAVISARV